MVDIALDDNLAANVNGLKAPIAFVARDGFLPGHEPPSVDPGAGLVAFEGLLLLQELGVSESRAHGKSASTHARRPT